MFTSVVGDILSWTCCVRVSLTFSQLNFCNHFEPFKYYDDSVKQLSRMIQSDNLVQ